jgi:MYXO-CTERM domain-containing protein
VNSCSQPTGYVADYSDCDDTLGATNPSASEVCDSIDNNCDGSIDEYTAIDALTWYDDSDFDGYGNPNDSMNSCSQPTGYVADNSDCNDGEETTYPGADEYCDGYDNNCNGNINENSAVDALNWYQDSDLDGYGNSNTPMNSCSQPTGYVADYSDCDDQDNTIHVEAEEIWYDGIDQNCDEWSDFDQDGDGFDHLDDNGDDCDDQDNTIHMEAEEIWYDGIDQNCDEWSDFDQDGDGQDSETYGGEDCDDSNLEIYTGALDEPYDGLITDCSNADDYDADGDGEVSEAFEGSDCDDSNSSIYSEAEEVWYDGIDQNCDENDNDQDEDGWILDEDCDDTDAESYPDNGELDSDCAQILSSLETEQNDKEGCSTASVKGRHLNPLALLLVGWIGTRRRRWT